MKKNGQEQVKYFWKPLCIVFAVLLALSWIFFGFLYSNGGVDFSTLATFKENQIIDNGTPVTDENGEQLPSDETIPMPKAMVFSSSAALDGTEAAYDSVTLTATVKPDDATNKSVDWSVEFVNPASEWAVGKTVTDYVTITPLSDGSTTAELNCLQAFGEQIKVVVKSRQNESAKAECTVDFAQRVISAKVPMYKGAGSNYGTYGDLSFADDSLIPSFEYPYFSIEYEDLILEYSDYTVEDDFSSVFTYRGTDEMGAKLTDGGFDVTIPPSGTVSPFGPVIFLNEFIFTGLLNDGQIFDLGISESDSESLNRAIEIVCQNIDIPISRLTLVVTGVYSQITFTVDIYTSLIYFSSTVESVSFDQTNVII